MSEAVEECKCALCRNNKDFETPRHLISQIERGDLVIFAGAGISTENRDICIDTLYDRLAHELGVDKTLPFPRLVELYCQQPDGRINFIKEVIDRFDYFSSFSDFYSRMTRFHRAIAPLFMLQEIVTTNWDDFFESECDFDAFVSDNDMPFWTASKRRLLKIHGPIRNLGSMLQLRVIIKSPSGD
jgi:hypothetical protein